MANTRAGTVNGDPQPFWNAQRGCWELRVTLPADDYGNRRRKVIRAKTKAEAVKRKREVLAELTKAGNLPTRSMTVEDYATAWLDAQRDGGKRAKTFIEYESVMRRHILPGIGKRRLAELQPGDVTKWLARVADTPKSQGTGKGVERVSIHVVKSARKVLSACLSSAEHDGLVSRNVAHIARMPEDARRNAPRAALTVDEARVLLKMLADSGDQLWTLWAAAILSGMRASELAGLRREDVTPDAVPVVGQLQRLPYMHGCGGKCLEKAASRCPKARLRTPKGAEVERLRGGLCWVGYGKTDASVRVIPNYGPLRAVLDRHMQTTGSAHGLMWERDGKPIDPNDLPKIWGALERTLELGKHIVPHAMRNTTAGLMFAAGVPEHVILNVLGHTELAMSRSYARQDVSAQSKELEAITRMLEVTAAPEAT